MTAYAINETSFGNIGWVDCPRCGDEPQPAMVVTDSPTTFKGMRVFAIAARGIGYCRTCFDAGNPFPEAALRIAKTGTPTVHEARHGCDGRCTHGKTRCGCRCKGKCHGQGRCYCDEGEE